MNARTAGEARRPDLVFVSACHSEDVGRAFVKVGVPHVVAITKDSPVLDNASQEFAESFYAALLQVLFKMLRHFPAVYFIFLNPSY